jgi:hypothetical protein
MEKLYLQSLLKKVLETCNDTATTDWLSYCMYKATEFNVLQEKTEVIQKSIKSGIPAVDTIHLIDNDFHEMQDNGWKDKYKILCRNGFAICIEIVEDVKMSDKDFVDIFVRQIFISFNDPDKDSSD